MTDHNVQMLLLHRTSAQLLTDEKRYREMADATRLPQIGAILLDLADICAGLAASYRAGLKGTPVRRFLPNP